MFGDFALYLRPIEEADLSFLAELRNDSDTWPYLGTINFTNLARQKAWLAKTNLDPKQYNFVLVAERQSVGYVRMDEFDPVNGSIRVGGDVIASQRGRGIGRKMYRLIFEFAFNYLRLNRVWLLVMANNDRALKLYTSLGMQHEGTLREAIFRGGKYVDYLVMSILKREYV